MDTDSARREIDALAKEFEHRVRFFARDVARRFQMGSRWSDELESAGYWGLAKALANLREDATDEERSAYVSQRIVGAVVDEARTCITRNARGEILASPVANGSDGLDDCASGDWMDRLISGPSDDPEAQATSDWVQGQVETALTGLEPPLERLMRAYMEGASLREISLEMGIPLATLRTRFEKATRMLRARMRHVRRVVSDSR